MSPGTDSDANSVSAAVADFLREERPTLLAAVADAADAVADRRSATDSTADGGDVADELERELRSRGVFEAFPDALAGCVAAAGRTLRATPVAAPPYVVSTSSGPVLRATLSDGRLVVTLRVFEVERGESAPRYVRVGGDGVGVAVSVEFVR
ncbi:hypothetical protein SAMN04488063_1704 [Halopelagius inordinatus]|uniref:DUF7988 domain-containing protein n=1 Tax=Halopelagius inordinatus TaxID=553467 RepID=A0A1I2QXZ0_9EURY|nr:hypothetical protein [Halopelagius inordinatus]SFG33108.1 hypothetical protein SAMN04488063_1704 [Halopelagius inordinatus]